MANARIARFITEVAPPQFVSVMRRRTSKVLDTINEEERDVCANNDLSPNTSRPKTIPSALLSSVASSSTSSSITTISGCASSKYFLKEVHRSLSIFNH